jgi:hypothetical protein
MADTSFERQAGKHLRCGQQHPHHQEMLLRDGAHFGCEIGLELR